MWDTVGIIAAVVVILLLFQMLDVVEILKGRLKGGSPRRDLESRITEIEARLKEIEGRHGE